MINPQLGLVLLFVANPLKSGEFYQTILGIKPIEQSPTFVMFALKNGVMLGLWSRYTAEPRVDAHAGAQEICFAVNDVDKMYEEIGNQRVVIAQKPTDMDFGRTFVFCDLDGHRIRLYKFSEEQ